MDLAVGQVYGEKYKIVRLLGQGSMGAVYEGENVRIHRKVAIKTLHAAVAEKGDTIQRFEREAQAAGRIGSMHICEVLDMGDLPDGSRFMVMEHLDGVTLQQHIRSNGRLRPAEAAPLLEQLLEGLGAAHQAGIIHRDLKPANVFLVRAPGKADFVKILDFGVSKFSVLSEEMSMTRTGTVLGTPYYMSPEQAKGARGTDARSDLYAVGVILYECITGQVPFSAETFNELLFRIVLESPPPPESFAPDLPASFAAIIRKAMAREPADRYQTAAEFKQALAEWAAENSAFGDAPLDQDDQKTLVRGAGPLAALGQRPASAPAPAPLRPAPPSTTASGAMVIQPSAAPAPAVAAQGTVIIDPDAAPANPAPAGPAPSNSARASLPTAPLPQWTEPPAQGSPQPGVPETPPGYAPWGPYSGDPGPPRAPLASVEGTTSMRDKPTGLRLPQRPRSAMRVVAFLGIAVGLLAGVTTWALVWRSGRDSDARDLTAATAAPEVTAAPPAADTATAAPGASETATAAPAETATAAPSDTATVAPSDTATVAPSDTATAAPSDTATAASSSTKQARTAPTGSSKAGATASAAASGAPTSTAKPGGTNPSGKRTVSTDL